MREEVVEEEGECNFEEEEEEVEEDGGAAAAAAAAAHFGLADFVEGQVDNHE